MEMNRRRGFTLIELLIVVAIVAILAGIAMVNFLEAQSRSKLSRIKSDFRTFATALESYCADHNHYPPNAGYGWHPHRVLLVFPQLTTPTAYMTSIHTLADPFKITSMNEWNNPDNSYLYYNLEYLKPPAHCWLSDAHGDAFAREHGRRAWCLVSWGPDGKQGFIEHLTHAPHCTEWSINSAYDPTNGTVSAGDVMRVGGVGLGINLAM